MSLRSAGAGSASIQPPPVAERGVQRMRRRLSDVVLHAPQTFRALVRGDELWLVALAAGVGLASGLCVHLMTVATQAGHEWLFALQRGDRLSGSVNLERLRAVGVPTLGGPAGGAGGLGDRALVEPAARSTRSRPTPCMAAACRSATACS